MRILAVLALLGLLLPTAARAEFYSSDTYGFSAAFPGSVNVMQPPYPGKGEAGNPIASMDLVMSMKPMAYMAFVVEVTINAPMTEAELTPDAMDYLRGQLLAGMGAEAGDVSNEKILGYPGSAFTFTNKSQGVSGRGKMVIIPGEQAKVYIVLGGLFGSGSDADRAAVDTFFDSFRLL